MVPNFHDTSVLDLLMMFVWSLPAIIAAIAALMTAKGQKRAEVKTDKNTGLLEQNAEKVEQVHKLVNSTLTDMTDQRDALRSEVGVLKDTARRESAKP